MLDFQTICTLYVSQQTGCDSNTGEIHTPLKTLEAAIGLVSEIRKAGFQQPVSVKVMDKIYTVQKPVVIDETAFSVTIEPFTETELRGGAEIRNFQQDQFTGMDCFSADISQLGSLSFSDFYVDGKPAEVTRYPETGTLSPADVEVQDPFLLNGSKWFVAKPEDLDVIRQFRNKEDAYISFGHFWVDEHTPIESIDETTGRITMRYLSRFTISQSRPSSNMEYVIENVAEMFGKPGQWYCDKKAKKLYYIPQKEEQDPVGYIPLTDKLFIIKGQKTRKAAHITIRNFTLCYTRGEYKSTYDTPDFIHPQKSDGFASDIQSVCCGHGSVELENAYGCAVENCRMYCLGVHAVNIKEGCSHISVTGNRISYLGGGGIYADGGAFGSDPATHTYGLELRDNTITYGGRRYFAACGILLRNVYECTVSHNEIAHLYYTGISCGWVWGYGDNICRDNRIEKNHIHHLGGGKLSDMGGIYTLGKQPGTVIRGNLIHDVISRHYGGYALYTDEGSSYITLENNICYNTTNNSFHQHYGSYNTVRNNIFAFSGEAPVSHTRSEDFVGFLCEHNIIVLDDAPPFFVKHEREAGMLAIRSRNNLIFDRKGSYDGTYLQIADRNFTQEASEMDSGSLFADPKFRDLEKFDFTLAEDSPAYAIGFQKIDCSDAGPRK